MKYMLLIYDNADSRRLIDETIIGEVKAVMGELTESGELVSTDALAEPQHSRVVRVRDGVPVITDGPFAEAKEHFGGYLIVDCATPERAAEIAARWPNARTTAMEVRPLLG